MHSGRQAWHPNPSYYAESGPRNVRVGMFIVLLVITNAFRTEYLDASERARPLGSSFRLLRCPSVGELSNSRCDAACRYAVPLATINNS